MKFKVNKKTIIIFLSLSFYIISYFYFRIDKTLVHTGKAVDEKGNHFYYKHDVMLASSVPSLNLLEKVFVIYEPLMFFEEIVWCTISPAK